MWKFLVCKGRQMTETVWLRVVRAWNMPGRGCQPTPQLGWGSRSGPMIGAR
jgi:hypothetical protein